MHLIQLNYYLNIIQYINNILLGFIFIFIIINNLYLPR